MKLPVWIATAATALCAALLPACDSFNLNAIHPGTTTAAEVRDRLGPPGYVHWHDDGTLVWEYSRQPAGIQCYMMPGNDDIEDVGTIIDKSELIVNPESKNIMIDDYHEMISLGYTNPTPWKTPRETSEEELARMIDAMIIKVKDMKNCIFNFHCPPYDTMLDEAPELDKNMRPMMSAGSLLMKRVGSTAIKERIDKYQPLLGVFGHIHEASGEMNMGRTKCLNPGSEYQNGVLRAYLVELDAEGIVGKALRIEG